ncbi:hypothetical protein CupriaWKF_22935 [Cupriavidus sp. WKF15]|uniref:hypothetical protein n=1 Tax=Cupriavidus sp. WKF15 TaxID=3032282 RepID=UPI0023E2CBB0|nr:hypothetical protein [Cupriavidus sp. WKF15]WER49962.1 hypothetical protein CupriaWKF_22935 [Cupriavidus sp. WKF15]
MKSLALLSKKALLASAVVTAVATSLASCGGGDDGGTVMVTSATPALSPASNVTQPVIIPANATFLGKTYPEWETAFWQWSLALPLDNPPHPFFKCNSWERPISAAQTGNVWYWSSPDAVETCDQSAIVIPAGKAIFLTTLDIEASSLDDPTTPFYQTTASGQLATAQQFANYIEDLFVFIDGTQVPNVTAYRTTTGQFTFTAPTPWVFNPNGNGGTGTAVGDGYFFMLQLPPGPHTIRYGGTFNIPKGVLGHKAVSFTKDVTLFITMGGG